MSSDPPRPTAASRRDAPVVLRLAWAAVAAASLAVAGTLWQLHDRPAPREGAEPQWVVQPAPAISGWPADWRLARMTTHPGVWLIEFPSLAAQGRAMNRLAALIEKAGAPRDRVLDDQELADAIRGEGAAPATYLYGHDYSAAQLARFFRLSASAGVALNDAEAALSALLKSAGGHLGALITISRPQADDPDTPEDDAFEPDMQAAVLRHEASHGVYFVDMRYAQACARFWHEVLGDDERARWRRHLAALGYDPADEDLMINETQAWLMHTPEPFGVMAEQLGTTPDRLHEWRSRFRALAGNGLGHDSR